jgi:hypothetical protein
MKRAKKASVKRKSAVKGKKMKRAGQGKKRNVARNKVGSVDISPPPAQLTLNSAPPDVVLQQIALVEAAIADLPPAAPLADRDRQELNSALRVLKNDPALETPGAKDASRRIKTILDGLIGAAAWDATNAAALVVVEQWPEFLRQLDQLVALLNMALGPH